MQSILIGVQRENLFSTITNIQAVGLESASAEYAILGGIERGTTSEDTNSFFDEYDWLVPNEFGYNYEVRASLFDGGALGTFDTFVAAENSPNWSVFALRSFGAQIAQAIIDFDFRRKGDTNILLSKRVTLIAEVT
jgi:hypothetical protein